MSDAFAAADAHIVALRADRARAEDACKRWRAAASRVVTTLTDEAARIEAACATAAGLQSALQGKVALLASRKRALGMVGGMISEAAAQAADSQRKTERMLAEASRACPSRDAPLVPAAEPQRLASSSRSARVAATAAEARARARVREASSRVFQLREAHSALAERCHMADEDRQVWSGVADGGGRQALELARADAKRWEAAERVAMARRAAAERRAEKADADRAHELSRARRGNGVLLGEVGISLPLPGGAPVPPRG